MSLNLRYEVFRVEKDPNGSWYVAPMSAANNGKYLILAKSEADGVNIRSRLADINGPKSPLEDPEHYEKLGESFGVPVFKLL